MIYKKKVWKSTYIDSLCEEKIGAALGLKKDGKTLTYKKMGKAEYLASTLSVYYDGKIYETMVVMLPVKADADWCIAHGDDLSDPLWGVALDMYEYCKYYKGLLIEPWEDMHGTDYKELAEEREKAKHEEEEEDDDDCELADDYKVIDYTENKDLEFIPTSNGGIIVSYDISEKEAWYQEHYLGDDKWDEYGSWLDHLAEINGISISSPTGSSIGF